MIERIKAWAGLLTTAVCATLLVAACGGGGGGSAGTPPFGTGSGADGGVGTTYTIAVSVQRAGVDATSITSTESVQARAVVRTAGGAPVSGVVVTFSESAAGIVKFAPASATALTDSSGVAQIDVSALDTSSTGATTINAAATIASTEISALTSIEIKAGSVGGPTPVPAAINFTAIEPAGTAIVIKGAGGNGRSESALLTFTVVDGSNQPIEGATVLFSANPSDKVTLNITSAVSNSSGQVTTTVQSGSSPTSVVITAAAQSNLAVTGQSDTLVVSNGVAVAGGFEIVAETYNLDGGVTGKETTVSAFVVDENGNPVPDGVAVSFTTDVGGIGSSTLGGCLTVEGKCDVTYRVQEPRGDGLATVVATVQVGGDTNLSDSKQLNLAGATGGQLQATDATGSVQPAMTLTSCKQTLEFVLFDSDTGRAPSAGTVIASASASSDVTVDVTSGTPVADQLAAGFPPMPFTVEVDVSATTLFPVCRPGRAPAPGGFVRLAYTSEGGIQFTQRFDLFYPQ